MEPYRILCSDCRSINLQNTRLNHRLHKSTHPIPFTFYATDPLLCLPNGSFWEATSSSPGDEISKECQVLASILRLSSNHHDNESENMLIFVNSEEHNNDVNIRPQARAIKAFYRNSAL